MKVTIRFLVIALWWAAQTVQAQPAGNPPQDIRASARQLSMEQKLKLLAYMRALGTSVDKEIQQTYEQLNGDKKNLAWQYLEWQKAEFEQTAPVRTSVQTDRDTIHFGRIEEGTLLLDTFSLTNTGFKPYIITDVRTSCDCTVLRYPEFPVMPGEKATLRVEFNSLSKAGRTLAGIILYDNSSPNGRTILYLEGEVYTQRQVKKIGDN